MGGATLPTLAELAKALGGEVSGAEVVAPGPGHSAADRSMSVKPDAGAEAGFIVHSFAGDDPIVCRDYVRERLGLRPFEPTQKKNGASKQWTPLAEYVYQDANGEHFLKVRKCKDETGKKAFFQYHWDGNGWAKGKPEGQKIPYRLPQLLAAPNTMVIYLVEGEKDADNLHKLGFVATTASEGAAAKWDSALTAYFKDRHVAILPDADRPGRAHAEKVARALDGTAASVRVLDLFPEQHDGSDVSDWVANDAAGAKLAKMAREAPIWEPAAAGEHDTSDADDKAIAELAELPGLAYAKRRKGAAEKIGIAVADLDRLVKAARAKPERERGEDSKLSGRAIVLVEPEPATEPVEGEQLLDDLAAAIGRHVVMAEHARDAAALWVVHDYLLDVFHISPRLVIRSPMKRCGKTTLLDVLVLLNERHG